MTTVDLVRANGSADLALANAPAPADALARLAQWVEAARNAHALVAPLVDTAFVPEAYKPKVDPRADERVRAGAREVAIANATAAVLQGLSLGLDPLQALQNIYVVHGRPGMYAKAMVALVQAHGHEVWTEEQTDTRAVVAGRRKGSEHIERITVTMDQARRAGWTSNQAYAKTPADMLWSRAAGRVCDRIASDVLKGITSVEQIRDEIRVEAEVGPATRTVAPRKRATAAIAAAEEPPLDDESSTVEPEPVDVGDAPQAITPEQSKTLHGLARAQGRNTKAKLGPLIREVTGRHVDDTGELTADEADAVIRYLQTDGQGVEDPAATEPEQPELEP